MNFISFLKILFVSLILGFIIYINSDKIFDYIMVHFIMKKEVITYDINQYKNDYNISLVKETDDFIVNNKQDINNVFYTVLNDGWDHFDFYCDDSYTTCLDDITSISHNSELLSTINNIVNPFNSYNKITISTNKYGKATINIEKLYTDAEINQVNAKIDEFINENIYDSMSVREKIKAFHDYLINKSIYDSESADAIKNNNNYINNHNSHKAVGPLINNIALCSGYSDAMKIYLDILGVPNYKIASQSHIWNLLYIDGKWLHLDLTWDDPVTSNGTNLVLDKFFLITTTDLKNLDMTTHNFNTEYYKEAL